jgi:hypothetical protein
MKIRKLESLSLSSEITGTGSAQATAHGLGDTPSLAFAVVTEAPVALGSGLDVAHGTHDATNCTFTVTSGIKYRVVAVR